MVKAFLIKRQGFSLQIEELFTFVSLSAFSKEKMPKMKVQMQIQEEGFSLLPAVENSTPPLNRPNDFERAICPELDLVRMYIGEYRF